MSQYKLVVYFLCSPRCEGAKFAWFCHGFDGLSGFSPVFYGWVKSSVNRERRA
jgi:hypothetical protein